MPATSRRLRVHFCIFLFVFLFIYLTLVGITLNQPGEFPRSYNVKVREIVAFSLQKQIEFDSVQIQCDEGLIGGDDGRGRKSDSDWVRVTDSNLFVYSVHLDKRLEPYHYVRVIGVTKGKWNNTVFYCQIHSSTTSDVVVVKANVQPIWFEQWDADTDRDAYYNPVLVSCGIPQGTNGSVVGLTTTPCSVGKDNVFEVEAKGEEKGNVGFTVCVKPMNFPTSGNVRELVQWIEINWILGAGRIEFYVENVGEKMMEVLKW